MAKELQTSARQLEAAPDKERCLQPICKLESSNEVQESGQSAGAGSFEASCNLSPQLQRLNEQCSAGGLAA